MSSPPDRTRVKLSAVLGTADGAPDFVYTRGLRHMGHPELLMTGWPRSGSEDEPDWHLSRSDLAGHMSRLVDEIQAGRRIELASRWTRQVDDGCTTLHFSARMVEEDDAAQPLMLSPDEDVLVLVFDVDRAPAACLRLPEPCEVLEVQRRLDEWVTAAEVVLGCDLSLPSLDPTRDKDNTYGPLAPALTAVLRIVEQLDVADYYDWDLYLWGGGREPQLLHGRLVEAARRCGRQMWLRPILDAAQVIADARTKTCDADARADLRHAVLTVTANAMLAWHLADCIDSALFDQATGILAACIVASAVPEPAEEAQSAAVAKRLEAIANDASKRALVSEDDAAELTAAAYCLAYAALTSGGPLTWILTAPTFPACDSSWTAVLHVLHMGAVASAGRDADAHAALIWRHLDVLGVTDPSASAEDPV